MVVGRRVIVGAANDTLLTILSYFTPKWHSEFRYFVVTVFP